MKLNTIYSYFIIILFAPLIGKLIKKIIIYYKSYKNFEGNNQLYNLVHRLTPHEFEIWCSEYLSKLGFNNIILLPLGPDGGKDIICEKGSEKNSMLNVKDIPSIILYQYYRLKNY